MLPGERYRREREAAQEWVRAYVRKLEERLQRERQRAAAIQGSRREEERLIVDTNKDLIDFYKRIKSPLPIGLASAWLRAVSADVAIGDPSDLQRWREDIRRKAAAMGVGVSYEVVGRVNAYAWSQLKRVELSPINSEEAYATGLHELGHCANPCQPSHRRAKTSDGHTVCVACECAAWRWGIRNAAPRWTRRMHNELQDALRTYRKYATSAEAKEIDVLIATGYHDARLARLKEI